MGTGRRVILTRPSSDSQTWRHGLEAAGHSVSEWPLIAISSVPATQRSQDILSDWSSYQAVMFVSRNAVTHTFALVPAFAGAHATRCWATGPGTRQALLEAGVPARLIDAPALDAGQFDTESLWQVVQPGLQTDKRVLILRGSEADQTDISAEGVGRDWLAQQLIQAGVQVDTLAVYQRACPDWDEQQMARASLAAIDGSVWVFSSSQAIVHLQKLLPAQDWSDSIALATHPRIGTAASRLGVGRVLVCKPVLGALLASLESTA